MSQFVLGHGVRVVDLVSQNHKRHLCQILQAEQLVKRVFRFWETLDVLCVDEVDDAVDFGKVLRDGSRVSSMHSRTLSGSMAHVAPYPSGL